MDSPTAQNMFVAPDGTFPQYVGDIKRSHPDWEEGNPVPEGWVHVDEETERPDDMPNARWAEGADPETDEPVAVIIWSNELAFRDDDPNQPYMKWTSEEILTEGVPSDWHPDLGPIVTPEEVHFLNRVDV